MPHISKKNRFADIDPQTLLSKVSNDSKVFLPHSLKQSAFNHHHESSGEMYGFSLQPPWEALPKGDWKVSIVQEKAAPNEKIYQISASSITNKLYSSKLNVTVDAIGSDTEITIDVDGQREVGLADFSDDLIETIIRSLIRESFTEIEALVGSAENSSLIEDDEVDLVHVAPLAIAAGLFSAGMALGLWFWRRKRKDDA